MTLSGAWDKLPGQSGERVRDNGVRF
jgi:hypothetical protein